jgi:flavin reductase (DIM6/NTAB) family NADH-FMN oxidoreductase RutF
MNLDLSALDPKSIYQTMIQCIVPRPIAWVLSDNGDQSFNLAPFSYFNGVSSKPPIISISIGKKRDGSKKDTWKNIEDRKHFVVHLAQTHQASQVSATAASLPFGESEITGNDLSTVQDPTWTLPRLEEAPIAMLCRFHQIVEVGETPQALVLGRIEQLYIADQITKESDTAAPSIDSALLDPLARLGGDDYAKVGPAFTVQRPH